MHIMYLNYTLVTSEEYQDLKEDGVRAPLLIHYLEVYIAYCMCIISPLYSMCGGATLPVTAASSILPSSAPYCGSCVPALPAF